MTATAAPRTTYATAGPLRRSMRGFTGRAGMFLVAVALLSAFLMPLAYMTLTAFKDQAQVADPGAPLYPASPRTFEHGGEALPIYAVPIDGTTRQLAIVEKGRESSLMIDPADPGAGTFVWQGRWRTLTPAWDFDPKVENFALAWEQIEFPKLLRNTGDHRGREHDRCGRIRDRRCLRLQPVPVPRSWPAVPDPAGHDHPAARRSRWCRRTSCSPGSAGPTPGCR